MNYSEWNLMLLLSAMLFVLGCLLSTLASTLRERVLSVGVLAVAVVFAFAANGAFVFRSEIHLSGIVLLILFGLWSALANQAENANAEIESAGKLVELNVDRVMRTDATTSDAHEELS